MADEIAHREQDLFALLGGRVAANVGGGAAAMMTSMPVDDGANVTGLLKRWKDGDSSAEHELVPIIYRQLHRMAQGLLRGADTVDARAATDLAISQHRLASVMPATRAAARGPLLESSRGILKDLLVRTPETYSLQMNLAIVESFLGDHFREVGQSAPARRHYEEVMAIADKLKGVRASSTQLVAFRSTLHLAVIRARSGDLAEAVRLLKHHESYADERAMSLANSPLTGEDLVAGRLLQPRLYEAYSAVYAAAGEREQARAWQDRASEKWRQLAVGPGFNARFQQEMQDVKALFATGTK